MYLHPPFVWPSSPPPTQTEEDKVARTKENQDIQVLTMNNERISVPEVMFNPSDIGLNQCGIAEAIMASLAKLPSELHRSLLSSILLVGGSTKFVGFSSRLYVILASFPNFQLIQLWCSETELQQYAPAGVDIKVHAPPEYVAS